MVSSEPNHIAVIDDDQAVLESLQFVLGFTGLQVATYPSAAAFLQSGQGRPRCLILDHHMPQMTGLELTARLRADGIHIPVLLITSDLSPDIVARAEQMGVERILEKPPAEADLISFIMAWL